MIRVVRVIVQPILSQSLLKVLDATKQVAILLLEALNVTSSGGSASDSVGGLAFLIVLKTRRTSTG
jgi:hypothetical protein